MHCHLKLGRLQTGTGKLSHHSGRIAFQTFVCLKIVQNLFFADLVRAVLTQGGTEFFTFRIPTRKD